MNEPVVSAVSVDEGVAELAAPVVYEVNLDIDAAIAGEYRTWLREHIDAMLALPGFVSAQTFDVIEPRAEGRVLVCVQYVLRDITALDAYLRDDAPRMRADGAARFGDRFSATRRVLVPLA